MSYRQAQALEAQIIAEQNRIISEGVEAVGTAAEYVWDAYMRSCQMLQEAQLLEAQLMLRSANAAYKLLDETEVIRVGMTSYHSYQAAYSFKKAMAYYLAPIPTIIDEGLAVGYAVKGLYHLCKCFEEVIK